MAALPREKPENSDGEDQPAFLGVECSSRGRRWVDRLDGAGLNTATALAQQHQIPLLLARVMAARGAQPDNLNEFLQPSLKNLMPDPSTLQDMDKAATRLAAAIRNQENIAVFGDYDVDGAASASLMTLFLRHHGLEPEIYIPDRLSEGYGPNEEAFTQLIENGATLIVTVDCGTMAHDPISVANSKAAEVIVVDHHLAGEALPDAHAVVNPNRHDDLSALGHLSAAGVTFMLLVATARTLRQEGWYTAQRSECDLLQHLDLVALATVCDVVPLKDLNRGFVRSGLQMLRQRRNVGLSALCDVSGLNTQPAAYHLGFVLGPRINAGGRIGDASLGVRLLTGSDDLKAAEIASHLDHLNTERKNMEAVFVEDALAQAERALEERPGIKALIVHGADWHKGVVGLVASRLCERFERPAIAIAWEDGTKGSGSARSVAGIDIGSLVVEACEAGHLLKGGGHAMAAGLTVERSSLDGFADFLDSGITEREEPESRRKRPFRIDGVMTPTAATGELLEQMEQAGPFGSGNPQPRFAFASHRCSYAKVVGEAHVRCTLVAADGSKITGVAFRSSDTDLGRLLLQSEGMPIHVAGHLRRNSWGGRESIELMIEDAAPASRKHP